MVLRSSGFAEMAMARQVIFGIAALCCGFILVATSVVRVIFEGVATGLATASQVVVAVAGVAVERNGTVLRNVENGLAVDVTSACDGHGLVVVLITGLFILGPHAVGQWLHAALLGLVAIMAFNLLRVVALVWALPATSPLFETLHYYVAPLVGACLVALVVANAVGSPINWRKPLIIGAVASLTALIWFFVRDMISYVSVVPLAEALTGTFAPSLGLTLSTERQATLDTMLVSNSERGGLLSIALNPADFALHMPLLVALSISFVRSVREVAIYWVAAVLLSALALAVAMVTASQEMARNEGLRLVLVPLGKGQGKLEGFEPWSQLHLAIATALQNALVHFNLFVLPFLPCLMARQRRAPLS